MIYSQAYTNQMCYVAHLISLMFIDIPLKETILTTTYITGLGSIIAGLTFNELIGLKDKKEVP